MHTIISATQNAQTILGAFFKAIFVIKLLKFENKAYQDAAIG
jgi:hypothetical protein